MPEAVLAVGPYPPPEHGTSLPFKSLVDFLRVRTDCRVDVLNTQLRTAAAARTSPLRFEAVRRLVRLLPAFTRGLLGSRRVIVYGSQRFVATAGSVFVLAARLLGRRDVGIYVQGGGFDHYYRTCRGLIRRLVQASWPRAKFVAVQTRLLQQSLGKEIANLVVVPNWVANERRATSCEHPAGRTSGDEVRMVFAGDVNAAKGIAELIQAYVAARAELKTRGQELFLDIYGPATDSTLSRCMSAVCCPGVRYFGRTEHDRLLARLAEYDMLVLPTVWPTEGYPAVVIEAMGQGLPAIVTRFRALPELVEHDVNGLLCEPRNPESLKEQMVRMASDAALRSRLGTNAREAAQRFQADAVVPGLCQALGIRLKSNQPVQSGAVGSANRPIAQRTPIQSAESVKSVDETPGNGLWNEESRPLNNRSTPDSSRRTGTDCPPAMAGAAVVPVLQSRAGGAKDEMPSIGSPRCYDDRVRFREFRAEELALVCDSERSWSARDAEVVCQTPGADVPDCRVRLPLSPLSGVVSASSRLGQALRLDVRSFTQVNESSFVAFAQGNCWFWQQGMSRPASLGRMRHGRGPLWQGACPDGQGGCCFGEYWSNPRREDIAIYHWQPGWPLFRVRHRFPAGRVRHIHAVQLDPYDGRVWFATGDRDSECMIGCLHDPNQEPEIVAQGSQACRAVSLMFTRDYVYWGTDGGRDSNVECNGVYRWSRARGSVERVADIGGPAYYSTSDDQGRLFLSTAVEGSRSERDREARLWMSENGTDWCRLAGWEKDAVPFIGGYGLLSFPHGPARSAELLVRTQGVKGGTGTWILEVA